MASSDLSRSMSNLPFLLPPKEPLPRIEDGISVLSFNVLLPNGNDGWWIYKSYQPHVPEEHRTWPYRRALMSEYIVRHDADVVCLQEASERSFGDDFSFMADAGYSHVLHSKFRFRSATFFKRDKFGLAFEKHKDRTLIVGLQSLTTEPELVAASAAPNVGKDGDKGDAAYGCRGSTPPHAPRQHTVIVNCHLTGGPVPERRLRQVVDALDVARKEAVKLGASSAAPAPAGPPVAVAASAKGNRKTQGNAAAGPRDVMDACGRRVPVVLCGDFNSIGVTAVDELLKTGTVNAEYREPGYPEAPLTSKDKKQAFGPFGDAYEDAYGKASLSSSGDGTSPPPTFMVPLLHPHFMSPDCEGISDRLKTALSDVFQMFSSNDAGESIMTRSDIDAWLLKINRALGRGSEYRSAEELLQDGDGRGLTLEDFREIYAREVREGKFWGVAHDLHVCGVELPGGMPWVGPYGARFDRIFYTQDTLDLVAVEEPLSKDQYELIYGGDCLPNSWHPSDHLGIGALLRYR